MEERQTPFDFRKENPLITEITRLLLELSEDQLRRVLAVAESIYKHEADEIADRMEKLTDLLTKLGRNIEDSKMTKKDKENSKDLLNRIVLNVYEQKVEVKDEWASLETVE